MITEGCGVKHGPTGETWYVLGVCVARDQICVAGWPPTIAQLSDCTLVRQARRPLTTAEREHRLKAFGGGWDEIEDDGI